MAALACPILLVAGTTMALIELAAGDAWAALWYLLRGLAAGAFSGGLFLLVFYAAYPLASDWITEWAGYVIGIAIGAASLLMVATLLFTTPLPGYVAVLLPVAGGFGFGFAIAGKLAGMRAPSARPRVKARTVRRR
jgi:hypothetical protein